MTEKTTTRKKIRGVLMDLSGTLHIGNHEIPGAREALKRLRSAAADDGGLAIRFLTNTSTKSVARLLDHLNDKSTLDFGISPEEMITSLKAAADYVAERDLHPLLLLEDASDFEVASRTNIENETNSLSVDSEPLSPNTKSEAPHDSVVVGLAPSKFCYEDLNRAFRILLDHPDNLIAVHRGNYLRDALDGGLSLGPGAFLAALEAAAKCSPATVLGKPSREIFCSAINSMNRRRALHHDGRKEQVEDCFETVKAEEVCMIGDDVRADCQGALDAGIGTAILVQTGKYRSGDEEQWEAAASSVGEDEPKGTLLVRPSIVEAIEIVLEAI